MIERTVSEKNFIGRLSQLIVYFDNVKIIRTVSDLEKKLRVLIIIKKILYFLTDSKINISLKEIKLKIFEIDDCNNKGILNETLLNEFFDECDKIEKKIEYLLKNEVQKHLDLFKSWERINNAFNNKYILMDDLPKFQKEFKSMMSIGSILDSNEIISNILEESELKIDKYKAKKHEFYDKILKYLESFSNKEFIERLIEGSPQPIKDLNPKMYEKLFKSVLKDKIKILLK